MNIEPALLSSPDPFSFLSVAMTSSKTTFSSVFHKLMRLFLS